MQHVSGVTNPGFRSFIEETGQLTSGEWQLLLISAAIIAACIVGFLIWYRGERRARSWFGIGRR